MVYVSLLTSSHILHMNTRFISNIMKRTTESTRMHRCQDAEMVNVALKEQDLTVLHLATL